VKRQTVSWKEQQYFRKTDSIDKREDNVVHMDKEYSKVNLKRRKSDFAFWPAQSYQKRLATSEEIRREFHQWKYHAEPRLQRVCRIVKQKASLVKPHLCIKNFGLPEISGAQIRLPSLR